MKHGTIPGVQRSGTTIQRPMLDPPGNLPVTTTHGGTSLPKTEREHGVKPMKPVPGASFVWALGSIAGLPAHSVWTYSDRSLFEAHLRARGITFASWVRGNQRQAARVFGV